MVNVTISSWFFMYGTFLQVYGCVWKCCVPHCTQWFCWSLSRFEKWLFHWEYTQHFQTNPYSWDLFVQGFSYDHRGKTLVFCRVQGKGSDGSGLHFARNAKMGTMKSQWFRKFPPRHRLHIWSKPFEERTSIKKMGCEKTHNEEQRWRYTTQKHQKFGKVVIWNGINKRWKMGDLASWSYYQPDLGKWRSSELCTSWEPWLSNCNVCIVGFGTSAGTNSDGDLASRFGSMHMRDKRWT